MSKLTTLGKAVQEHPEFDKVGDCGEGINDYEAALRALGLWDAVGWVCRPAHDFDGDLLGEFVRCDRVLVFVVPMKEDDDE